MVDEIQRQRAFTGPATGRNLANSIIANAQAAQAGAFGSNRLTPSQIRQDAINWGQKAGLPNRISFARESGRDILNPNEMRINAPSYRDWKSMAQRKMIMDRMYQEEDNPYYGITHPDLLNIDDVDFPGYDFNPRPGYDFNPRPNLKGRFQEPAFHKFPQSGPAGAPVEGPWNREYDTPMIKAEGYGPFISPSTLEADMLESQGWYRDEKGQWDYDSEYPYDDIDIINPWASAARGGLMSLRR